MRICSYMAWNEAGVGLSLGIHPSLLCWWKKPEKLWELGPSGGLKGAPNSYKGYLHTHTMYPNLEDGIPDLDRAWTKACFSWWAIVMSSALLFVIKSVGGSLSDQSAVDNKKRTTYYSHVFSTPDNALILHYNISECFNRDTFLYNMMSAFQTWQGFAEMLLSIKWSEKEP